MFGYMKIVTYNWRTQLQHSKQALSLDCSEFECLELVASACKTQYKQNQFAALI